MRSKRARSAYMSFFAVTHYIGTSSDHIGKYSVLRCEFPSRYWTFQNELAASTSRFTSLLPSQGGPSSSWMRRLNVPTRPHIIPMPIREGHGNVFVAVSLRLERAALFRYHHSILASAHLYGSDLDGIRQLVPAATAPTATVEPSQLWATLTKQDERVAELKRGR